MLRIRHVPFIAVLVFVFSSAALAGDASVNLKQRFDYLSTNGNSNCSIAFRQSIPTMTAGQMLRGSCCGEMVYATYAEQIESLKSYSEVPEIPGDPYDIDAHAAAALLAADASITLTAGEQAVFDYALAHAEEGGPCCCHCWRWDVYSGLAKKLIRERGFSGDEIAKIWDLSSGCGS